MPSSTQANGLGKGCRKATAADSCPASYPDGRSPGGDSGSSGSSPDDDPPWWPKLWKAKKVRRRVCVGAGVGLPIMFQSPSLLSVEGNGNERVVAEVTDNTEEEDPVVAATVGDNAGGEYSFFESPGWGGIHASSLDFDLEASGLEGADFFQANPCWRHNGYRPR